MKHQQKYSRRALLKSLGVGAALLPVLESDPADAACLVGGIKRVYIICWPNGMMSNVSSWATAGNDPASWNLSSFQSALQPYKSDLLLLNGVDYKFIKDQPNPNGGETNGHACFPGMLTGKYYQSLVAATSSDVGGGISVDQYIGNQLKAAGYPGLATLNLGTFVKSTGRLSWKAAGQAVLPDADPYHVFDTYFAGKIGTTPVTTGTTGSTTGGTTGARGTTGGGTNGTTGMSQADVTRAMNKSILDSVAKDLNRYMGIVGTEDKQRIQSHLDSVRQLEQSMAPTPTTTSGGGTGGAATGSSTGVAGSTTGMVSIGSSAACNAPTLGTKISVSDTANGEKITKMHMDLAIAGLAADLTRVVVMQITDQGAANFILTWLGFAAGGANGNTGDLNGYHSIAHRNDSDKTTCDAWFQSQLAYVIGGLKSITDPSGVSVLDNTAFLAMNNMRTGNHETTKVPVVMAGSCGGYFKTGRSLALPAGTTNNGILCALCNAMGFHVDTFGETTYGGELAVLKG